MKKEFDQEKAKIIVTILPFVLIVLVCLSLLWYLLSKIKITVKAGMKICRKALWIMLMRICRSRMQVRSR